MNNRSNSIFFGLLMGLCIPLFVWILFFEHIAIFILLPIFPVVGVLSGFVLGSLGKIPSLKVWVSLLIFTIFVGLSFGYSEIRGLILHSQRVENATDLAMQYPGSKILSKKYSYGNGMEEPPNVEIIMKNNDSFEEIARNYDSNLKQNGWRMRHGNWKKLVSWRKDNFEIFLYNEGNDELGKTTYSITVDYLGYWMTHFRNI